MENVTVFCKSNLNCNNPLEINMTSAIQKNQRSESMTSRFYAAEKVDHKLQSFIETTATNIKPKTPDAKMRQSRHLPLWAWYIIAKCIGIPLTEGSKPILGTILHALTFASALVYAISYTWYIIYDILSPKTARDIPGGTVSILLVYFWCGFGFYCKDLSSRLFLHSRFLKDIRMHARSVFKINGALLAFILGSLFAAANITESLNWYYGKYCDKIELAYIICYLLSISSIIFTLLTLIWHSLVTFVFMSVCRTHTIGLRRFIKEIEYDALVIENHLSFTNKIFPSNQDDIWQESLWIAEEENEEEFVSYSSNVKHSMSVSQKDINPTINPSENDNKILEEQGEISTLFAPINENLEQPDDRLASSEFEWNHFQEDKPFIPVRQLLVAKKSLPEDSTITPHKMTNDELVHHFWKLNCRLRFSSCALQRWYASFVSLVLMRCATYLVHWLGHPALLSDILQFAFPLILLIVLSTAIAEVNFEGQRVLRCIYPTHKRIRILQYMALNPLQMSVYGFGMTHATIVAAAFAMLVGFATKVLITEMTK